MAKAACSRCERPLGIMSRDFSSTLCSKCRAEDARKFSKASQAATLESLRRFEDRLFGILLIVIPTGLRPGVARALSGARVRGLVKLIAGFAAMVPMFFFLDWVGRLTGVAYADAFVVLPLVVSLIGLIEIILGISFADLADRFDRGGILLKLGIIVVVLSVIALFVGAGIWAYRRYY